MPNLVRVTSDDPALAAYADMSDDRRLRRAGLFVAEGRFVVQRVLADSRYQVQSLLLSEAACRALERDLAALAPDVPVYVIPGDAFETVTGFDIHRGCLALVERPAEQGLCEIVARAKTVVVLEDVANPDNVGGVFRNAAAFGAGAVLLSPGCCDPLYRKAIRTSMGAVLSVPFARLVDWPGDLYSLRAQGFVLAALTPKTPADTLEALASTGEGRIALLAGAEGAGLTRTAVEAAEVRIRIPIAAGVDSLNVSVALGIALHAVSLRRGVVG